MADEPLRILFIHGSWPNQFSQLHAYFQETKKAESFFLTSEQDRNFYQQHRPDFPANVFGYSPDGTTGPESYYYSGPAEHNARHGLHVLRATKHIIASHKVNLVVAHALLGHAYLLFDEIDVPIISYVEYPSFRHHRWDPQYPPMDGQRYCDKFDEMINYFAGVKSDLVITPSRYAKAMFPAIMQDNIVAQMEAFNPKILKGEPDKAAFKREPGCVYIGFFANVLASEKGLEHFIHVSKRLSDINPTLRFVLIGDAKGPGYCFESIFLEKRFGKDSHVTFRDYLFTKYNVNDSLYISTGRLDTQSFSATIEAVDFFLYPLLWGSANWGVFELMLRGKVVIASNRCFLPEFITDGENGFLLEYENIDAWVELANKIAADLPAYQPVGQRAAQMGEKFHLENTAQDYLKIFGGVVARRKAKRP